MGDTLRLVAGENQRDFRHRARKAGAAALALLGRGLIRLIRVYQSTAPWRPPACRFSPTCSEYMAQSVVKYGPLQGVWRGVKRIGRCHPFHPGGYDPVP